MSGWQIFGASVRGPGHIASGVPNQDAWRWQSRAWGDVVAVSDGVGSRQLSHYGSRAACKAVAAALRNMRLNHKNPKLQRNATLPMPALLPSITQQWLSFVNPFPPQKCSATCLFAFRPSLGHLLVGMLGDGLIALQNMDGSIVFLAENKSNSFSNTTEALSTNTAPEQWRTLTFPQETVKAIVLCTDGVSDDLLPDKREEFIREWIAHFAGLSSVTVGRHLRQMLRDWPVPKHTDDKTIACLCRTRDAS